LSSRSIAANGSSSGSMKTRPMTLITSTHAPFLASMRAEPRPGAGGC
jgi:hypothetical protein